MGSENIIMSRIHPAISDKLPIWNLIADSYVGGDKYLRRNHLFRYVRETELEYRARLKRSVYFNHVQPLADILSGMLFNEPVLRDVQGFEYLLDRAHKNKSLDAFMMNVSIYSLLYTCGILVDAPDDAQEYATLADRQAAGKNPYCVFYHPFQICDFAFDDEGCLEWILLDNSYTDSCDPYSDAKKISTRRLWTEEFYQDFYANGDDKNREYSCDEPVMHGLGKVPFIFVNWKDVNDDYIADSPFEDIALLDRHIYNLLSYLDEMLASGTFKTLFFPLSPGEGVPEDLKKNGIGNLTVTPYDGSLSNKPFFDGPNLTEINPFIQAMQIYEKQILSKVGLDKDTEKSFAQSGIAKSLEYKKAESLLKLGAIQMENTEKEIFRLCALWEGKQFTGDITYSKTFSSDDIDAASKRLLAMFSEMPYQTVKNASAKELVNKLLPDLTEPEKQQIIAEIDGTDGSLTGLANKLQNKIILDNPDAEPMPTVDTADPENDEDDPQPMTAT